MTSCGGAVSCSLSLFSYPSKHGKREKKPPSSSPSVPCSGGVFCRCCLADDQEEKRNLFSFYFSVTPAGFEPAIFWMKTRRPRPLDDGANRANYIIFTHPSCSGSKKEAPYAMQNDNLLDDITRPNSI